MRKHTPGPWRWSDEYSARDLSDTWTLLGSDGHGILSCDGIGNSPQCLNKSDASLIAAAPDILEALALADCLLSGANMNRKVIKQKVKAAIAKAKGDTP